MPSPWRKAQLKISIERGRGASRQRGRLRLRTENNDVELELGSHDDLKVAVQTSMQLIGDEEMWIPRSQRERISQALSELFQGPSHGRTELTVRVMPRQAARRRREQEEAQQARLRTEQREHWFRQASPTIRAVLQMHHREIGVLLGDLKRAAEHERIGIRPHPLPWKIEPRYEVRQLAADLERRQAVIDQGTPEQLDQLIHTLEQEAQDSELSAIHRSRWMLLSEARRSTHQLPNPGSIQGQPAPHSCEAAIMEYLKDNPQDEHDLVIVAHHLPHPGSDILQAARSLHGRGLIELHAREHQVLIRQKPAPARPEIWIELP